ncbi:MAG TPA: VWA domain-containing protein [Gemmatimonadales bacterium]|nr:VWA domain-containing protein [Gemmatimonadales bacterium]
MRVAEPWALLLLALPLAEVWRRWRARGRPPAARLEFPALRFLAGAPATPRARWPWLPAALRILGVVLLLAALARPQSPEHVQDIRIKSRNLVLALDISSSMKAGDYQPGNRLLVARQVLADFVRRREGDLMGLVVFSGRAFLQAPLTPDAELMNRLLEQVDIGQLPDGTAIGTALALSLAQLKDLPPEASAIVLVTDGANNTGSPTPFVAAEAARALGIRIHAIGLSTPDTSGFQDDGFLWREGRQADRLTRSDEAVLRRLATRTGGRYFRATDPESLDRVVGEIEQLERNEVRIGETRDWRELFPFMLVPAIVLLGAELALGLGRWRGLP